MLAYLRNSTSHLDPDYFQISHIHYSAKDKCLAGLNLCILILLS